jgi:hypothetical protein
MPARRLTLAASLLALTFSLAPSALGEEAAPSVLQPMADDDGIGAAAGVVKLDTIPGQTWGAAVRMFGIAGSDPAANGLKTYLAFVTPHDSQVFLVGDFLDYRVTASAPGRIDLEIDETSIDEGGNMGQATRRATVTWTEMPDQDDPNPAFPATVTLTPVK